MKLKKKFNINISGNPNGKPIIFIHGYGCDQSMWRFVAPAFAKEYKVILLDLIGAGLSDIQSYDVKKYSHLSGYADDIAEICTTLNLMGTILVGHSVSAMISMLASIKRPDIFHRLVLVAPSPCYFNTEDYHGGFEKQALEELIQSANTDFLGWARSMAPAIMGRADRPELGVELTNSFCRTNPEVAKHFAKVVFLSDNRSDLKHVTVPNLILQCSQDIVSPEPVGRYMKENLPQNTFHQLSATGHCPHVSAPDETITAIKQYLAV